MRQSCFALILIGCSLLFGLGRATTAGQEATAIAGIAATPASCTAASSEENVEIARAWHEDVINHQNPAILSDILDPHAVHHAAGARKKCRGQAARS